MWGLQLPSPQRPRTPWLLPPSLTLPKDENPWAPIRINFRLNALSDGNGERQSDGETQGSGMNTRGEDRDPKEERLGPQGGAETPRGELIEI